MIRPSLPFLRRTVFAALAGLVFVLAPALRAAQPARKAFDIPAGPASETLKVFSAQSGEQLLYAAATVETVRTASLKGEFTPREALETMVRDTPLAVVTDRTNGALSLVRAPAPNAPRAAATPSAARPATNPANNSAAAEQALILSPFTVSTERDTGYAASSTLAGTRLAAELRDVATSITVITPEFLRDTGATDTQGFLPYVAGAEVSGLAGNFQGGAGVDAPRATTRLRGLAAATESRNFFGTGIPLDSYNVDRIEVNRGANSILFGTGSPAGIINNTLATPKMRNTYAAELRADSNESLRATFDLDHQLIKGQLALRVIGLEDRQRYEQDFAFSDDRRLYAAAVFDPKRARTANAMLSGTVLRANAEIGRIDNRNPRTQPPTDSVTGWFNPWFGGYPVKFAWDAGSLRTTTVIDGAIFFNVSPAAQTTPSLARNLNVWFDNPASGQPGTGSTFGGSPIVFRQGVISNLPTTVGPIGNAYFGRSPDLVFAASRTPGLADPGFWSNPSMTDTSIMDFRGALPEGPNRSSYYDFDTLNVSLEQRFLRDRAGFEIVMDRQKTDAGGSQLAGNEIRIDNNTTLLDGTRNPNFGRPSIGGPWTQNRATTEGRTARATAYFKFDFAEVASPRLAPWLGRHTFTALREEGRTRSKTLNGDRFGSDTDYIYGASTQITDLNGARLVQLSYLGPSLANRTTASGAAIPPLTALQLPTTASGGLGQSRGQLATSSFVYTPLRTFEDDHTFSRYATSASRGGQDWVSKAVVLQSHMLHSSVVTTFGWRRDDYETRNGINPPRGPRNNLLVDDANFPFAPAVGRSGRESIAKGGVVHLPPRWLRWQRLVTGISGRYNRSENFAPGGARFDPNGRRLDPVTGTTEDYGVLLELADRRVVLSATWYETAQSGNNAAGIANLTQTGILTNVYQRWQQTTNQGLNPNAAQLTPPPREFLDLYAWNPATATFNARPDIVLTQDFVAKGLELEMHANLTRQWRTVFSAARQEASRSNTGGAFRELFFERKINGQTLFENWTGPAGRANYINESRITVADQTITSIVNPYNNQALQDGGPVAELRKWRWSVVSNYDFARDSRLRGMGFGGGAIWQDKIAIGFPVISAPGGARIANVRNPYFGPRELTINAWLSYKRRILSERVGLTLRLGVYNVLNDDALVPVTTQPTGQIATFRIPESRRWQLTTRFEF